MGSAGTPEGGGMLSTAINSFNNSWMANPSPGVWEARLVFLGNPHWQLLEGVGHGGAQCLILRLGKTVGIVGGRRGPLSHPSLDRDKGGAFEA